MSWRRPKNKILFSTKELHLHGQVDSTYARESAFIRRPTRTGVLLIFDKREAMPDCRPRHAHVQESHGTLFNGVAKAISSQRCQRARVQALFRYRPTRKHERVPRQSRAERGDAPTSAEKLPTRAHASPAHCRAPDAVHASTSACLVCEF